jgi:arylsulfatase A-like enzyme
VQRVTEPRSATSLPPGEVTIAERLRGRGYRTAVIGKWHLGRGESGPANQGFDVAIGGEDEAAPASFFAPYGLARLPDRGAGEYLTDRLTDEALAFLDASAGQPFFLVLSHFAVHTPIEAPADSVAVWKETLAARPDAAPEPEDSLRAAYAAMLESVDRSVARVLGKLDDLGVARDTVVILTSDNGAVLETPDTGQPVTTNGSMRGGKAMLYEGGLRVPLLVRWPAVIGGEEETDFATGTTDWFPTLLEIAGVDPGGENTGASLDGASLLPVLRGSGSAQPLERSLHFHYPHYIAGYRHDPARETWWNTPGAAVRAGSLKLVRRFDGASELYDLDDDPSETVDLAAARPADVRRLEADLDRWLQSQNAHLPRTNLAYDAGAFAREIEGSLAALGKPSEWTPNGGCTSRVDAGELVLACDEAPFIVGPEMIAPGPLRVAVRFRSEGTRGAPALWYRASDKPAFAGDRVALVATSDPAVREGRLDRAGTIRQLRIDFGRSRGGRAAVDWIRIVHGEDGERTLVEWSFDRAEAQANAR